MIVNDLERNSIEVERNRSIVIDAAPNGNPMDYRKLNGLIHQAIDQSYKKLTLNNICGQRFIGASLQGDLKVEINGLPGNDLGIFMDGPQIHIKGNCEDQAGNTMNEGTIVIHGNGGDVIGLSARGGKIYVKENVGYRVGIHMKEFEKKFPVMIIGGTTKGFLGEYMAGGLIIVLGLKFLNDGSIIENNSPITGNELGTGIHRGKILLRTDEELESQLGVGAKLYEINDSEMELMNKFLEEFCEIFNIPIDILQNKPFKVVKPISKRPFGSFYCSQMV